MSDVQTQQQLTLVEAARTVLRQAGQVMSLADIWDEIKEQGLFHTEGKTPERTLSTVLRRATKDVEMTSSQSEKFFYLAGPSVFGLIEWLEETSEARSDIATPLRSDANSIGLRVIRSILSAATDFSFELLARMVTVRTETLPTEGWPRAMAGLDEKTDGPWPRAVKVEVTWDGGATELRIKAKAWNNSTLHGDACGISVQEGSQELLWITVPASLKRGVDGSVVQVPASISLFRNREPLGPRSGAGSQALAEIVRQLGVPSKTRQNAEAFTVELPSGDVGPSPVAAFERLVKISIAKLPFMSATSTIYDPVAAAKAIEENAFGGKSAGLQPLPGGVRAYKQTLDKILDWIGTEEKTLTELREFLSEEFDATASSIQAYVQLLRGVGVLAFDENSLSLNEAGREYVHDKSANALFEIFHRQFTGMLETLVVVQSTNGSTAEISRMLPLVLGVEWRSASQVNLRRNWLLSLGLLERDREGDSLSSLGKEILQTHSEEVLGVEAELEKLATDEGVEDDEEDSPAVVTTDEPPGWSGERIQLSPDGLQDHLGNLELPAGLLAQACAALSAGKHLLLVGPPGTGKTDLAKVLARAASSDGYCAGLFESTASADWTTYETVGGYALERNGALSFRSGVFLRAIEQWKWLLIDELNRADIDKAFGELMTVLSGHSADTPFVNDEGKLVTIGPEETRTHVMPKTFRVIATMNIWDKTSLFRLSYAVQRRFAIIHVGIPEAAVYERLLRKEATKDRVEAPLEEPVTLRLIELFSTRGVCGFRDIGAAIPLDMIRYMRVRSAGYAGLSEAIAMFLLPQLEGVDPSGAEKLWPVLSSALGGNGAAESYLKARFLELFPLARIS